MLFLSSYIASFLSVFPLLRFSLLIELLWYLYFFDFSSHRASELELWWSSRIRTMRLILWLFLEWVPVHRCSHAQVATVVTCMIGNRLCLANYLWIAKNAEDTYYVSLLLLVAVRSTSRATNCSRHTYIGMIAASSRQGRKWPQWSL